MAITEGNDKIPTPTSTLGEREHKLSHAEAAEQQNNAARASAPVAPHENSDTTPTPPETLSPPAGGIFGGGRRMQPLSDNHAEQVLRAGQGEARGFGAPWSTGRRFVEQARFASPITLSRTEYVHDGVKHVPLNEPEYEIVSANIEEFFANYITQLPSLKEVATDKGGEIDAKVIRTTLLVLRELRTHVTNQCKLSCALDAVHDPFFVRHQVPRLIPVVESKLSEWEYITFDDYTERLHVNFQNIAVSPPQYAGIVGRKLMVGLKDNKHYLIMPEPLKLFEHVGAWFEQQMVNTEVDRMMSSPY